jgi:hypothetical protein
MRGFGKSKYKSIAHVIFLNKRQTGGLFTIIYIEAETGGPLSELKRKT